MKETRKEEKELNTVFSLDKRPTIYAYSTRPISKGEEICDAYSGVFSIADKEDRDTVHQRYHFQVCTIVSS